MPNPPGLYLFSDSARPIYVGQTRKLRTRLRQHTGERSRQNQASLAFNIAKRDAASAGVDVTRSREALAADAEFRLHLDEARRTVAAMSVQFIELDDPIRRTLFEVYATLLLQTTEFNSFETH